MYMAMDLRYSSGKVYCHLSPWVGDKFGTFEASVEEKNEFWKEVNASGHVLC